MKVGLTYDLRDDYVNKGLSVEEIAELDSAATIEELEKAIKSLGYEVVRIGNIKELIHKLARNERWELVFNIAEGIYGMGREAQIPAVLDAYRIPYTFSDTVVLSVALQKALTKRIVSDLGIPTADFHSVRTCADIYNINLPFPLFAKPVAEGTGKGINNDSVINTYGELDKVCRYLLKKYKQPVLVETYLPGKEYTVGLIGTGNKTKVVGIMEIELKTSTNIEVYGFHAKEMCEHLVDYKPLKENSKYKKLEKFALKVHKGLNCRDASRIDFKEDADGNINFLEINPLAGLHPTHSDLPIICSFFGIEYPQLIKMIIDSARERINPTQ